MDKIAIPLEVGYFSCSVNFSPLSWIGDENWKENCQLGYVLDLGFNLMESASVSDTIASTHVETGEPRCLVNHVHNRL